MWICRHILNPAYCLFTRSFLSLLFLLPASCLLFMPSAFCPTSFSIRVLTLYSLPPHLVPWLSTIHVLSLFNLLSMSCLLIDHHPRPVPRLPSNCGLSLASLPCTSCLLTLYHPLLALIYFPSVSRLWLSTIQVLSFETLPSASRLLSIFYPCPVSWLSTISSLLLILYYPCPVSWLSSIGVLSFDSIIHILTPCHSYHVPCLYSIRVPSWLSSIHVLSFDSQPFIIDSLPSTPCLLYIFHLCTDSCLSTTCVLSRVSFISYLFTFHHPFPVFSLSTISVLSLSVLLSVVKMVSFPSV